MQVDFIPGAIFIRRKIQRCLRKKNLYAALVDLKKAFERMPRDDVGFA